MELDTIESDFNLFFFQVSQLYILHVKQSERALIHLFLYREGVCDPRRATAEGICLCSAS